MIISIFDNNDIDCKGVNIENNNIIIAIKAQLKFTRMLQQKNEIVQGNGTCIYLIYQRFYFWRSIFL